MNDQLQLALASTSYHEEDDDREEDIRDIHALTPPPVPQPPENTRAARLRSSSSLSVASTEGAPSENFSSMSREFNALVLAGSSFNPNNVNGPEHDGPNNLGRIGEEEPPEQETNPLAIVPDNEAMASSPRRAGAAGGASSVSGGEVTVQRVKKEEVETKISAWQTAKIAKINNRFKREDAIINGWESEEVQKASSWMKKVERKLEEKRAKALEKMQNDIAKARRKAEERRASAEATRGTKVARVLEIANLMRAVGRAPVKRSFF
ncbi:remorin 4.1 [Ipomoea triloba]|uniref:remorin 4.1 n=1 Tax=Ipomoea triloba TaxID=35885 RepID=UPI00125D99FE|nr:remorin 4.1 [Ipomoea triloba]XP_031127012.1 remorin 4.1 [Ipomoea triloba]XP_031127013.1 remorin 4.1 [Ipomoea triloba]XP_031127014.1 remorin 4.1 [Ipomoea triloba]XP_031127016.1 remorin 4.1 [Ipomoea triloba]XP_031127017.1 remorin 4.1 [Ipomoea triloba]